MHPEIEPAFRRWQRITDYLVALAESLPPKRLTEPSPYDGWSYKDVLAHVASGYVVRIAHFESLIDRDALADPIDIDRVNARKIGERRGWPVERLVEELRERRELVGHLMARLRSPHLEMEIDRSGPPPYRQRVAEYLLDLSAHDLEHAAVLAALTDPPLPPPEV